MSSVGEEVDVGGAVSLLHLPRPGPALPALPAVPGGRTDSTTNIINIINIVFIRDLEQVIVIITENTNVLKILCSY